VAHNPPPVILDHLGRRVTAGTSGRWFRRSGASTQGTLSNWVSQIINNRIAESEKRKISDRAWDLYLNDAMAHGIVEGLLTEVIGTGLTPQAQPMLSWLGLDIGWQQEYQQRIYDLFEIWGMDPRNWCDATSRQNIYMLQALALFHWKLDGIGLFQVLWKKDPARPLSLSLLPIDPSRLVTPTDKQQSDIYNGVELDGDGAPVAVWIIKESKFKYSQLYITAISSQCQRIPVYDPATGLPNILLVCDVRNIAEYRQDSIFGSMIKELRDNSDFTEAALVKALISNLFALFVEDTYGTQMTSATDWADRIQEVEKGTIIVGQNGEKPHVIENDAPGPNFEIMFKTIVRRLGMASCRGPENISREYNSSYSASMASMENAAKFDDSDRMTIINRFCQPVLMWMSYEAVLRGLLPVKSAKAYLQNLYAYTRSEWLPPKARPIDKQKAANADQTRLANGTRTYSDIFGEQSKDWRAMRRQRAVELAFDRELEAEYGVSMGPQEAKTAPEKPEKDEE
jgi:lambda family phage portal protein